MSQTPPNTLALYEKSDSIIPSAPECESPNYQTDLPVAGTVPDAIVKKVDDIQYDFDDDPTWVTCKYCKEKIQTKVKSSTGSKGTCLTIGMCFCLGIPGLLCRFICCNKYDTTYTHHCRKCKKPLGTFYHK